MKKLLLLFLIICSPGISADWVYFGKEKTGYRHWYKNDNIFKNGNFVRVWEMNRRQIPSNNIQNKTPKYRISYGSSESYWEINCREYQLKPLARTFFKDPNWQNQVNQQIKPSKNIDISLQSVYSTLVDIVCEQQSL